MPVRNVLPRLQRQTDHPTQFWADQLVTTAQHALDELGDTVGTVSTLTRETATATGSVQGDAYAITKQVTVFTTVAAGTGGRLPASVASKPYWIRNAGANQLTVYPASGANWRGQAANVGLPLAPGGSTMAIGDGTIWDAW